MAREAIAIYNHWPFCRSTCPYCDFNSHVAAHIDHEAWRQAYLKEIAYFGSFLEGRTITSIFFGGGTPSLMEPETVATLLKDLQHYATFSDDIEITLEANPTSVEATKFAAFREAGVNRVSLGVQALNQDDLSFLGRQHSAGEALDAIALAAKHFDRYSFDLIYARPHQTAKSWEAELKEALTYAKGHLSLYQLTIEKGTPFFKQYQQSAFTLPDEELAAELYQCTQEVMHAHGLPAYEVSNHAAPGHACRHNMTYWEYGDYLGLGPGAHSRFRVPAGTAAYERLAPHSKETSENHAHHMAMMMTHNPASWLKIMQEQGHAIQQAPFLSEAEVFEEMLLMGLRLTDGMHHAQWESHLGKPLDALINVKNLEPLINEGYLTYNDTALTVTAKGQLVLNRIISHIVEAYKI